MGQFDPRTVKPDSRVILMGGDVAQFDQKTSIKSSAVKYLANAPFDDVNSSGTYADTVNAIVYAGFAGSPKTILDITGSGAMHICIAQGYSATAQNTRLRLILDDNTIVDRTAAMYGAVNVHVGQMMLAMYSSQNRVNVGWARLRFNKSCRVTVESDLASGDTSMFFRYAYELY